MKSPCGVLVDSLDGPPGLVSRSPCGVPVESRLHKGITGTPWGLDKDWKLVVWWWLPVESTCSPCAVLVQSLHSPYSVPMESLWSPWTPHGLHKDLWLSDMCSSFMENRQFWLLWFQGWIPHWHSQALNGPKQESFPFSRYPHGPRPNVVLPRQGDGGVNWCLCTR